MATLIDLVARSCGMTAEQFLAGSTAAADAARAAAAPAIAEERRIVPAYLSGRCANGYARDRGRLVHAVEARIRGDRVDLAGAALCGATYGRRSAGWTHEDAGAVYTCAKCAKRAAAR